MYLRCRDVAIDDLTDLAAREAHLADWHKLNGLLAVYPWQWHPTEFYGDEPPAWVAKDERQLSLWREGRRLKQALEEAVAQSEER